MICKAFLWCELEIDEFIGKSDRLVEDILRAIIHEIEAQVHTTFEIFEAADNEKSLLTLSDMHITNKRNTSCIEKEFLNVEGWQILSDAEFTRIAWLRIKLRWLADTMSDLVFQRSKVTQATQPRSRPRSFKTSRLSQENKLVLYMLKSHTDAKKTSSQLLSHNEIN